MAPVHKVRLDEAAAARPEYWSQEVVGEANGSLFKVAKGTGATEWHAHADMDEVFVVTGARWWSSCATARSRSRPARCSSCRAAWSTGPRAEGDARFLIVGTEITSNAEGGKPAWSATAAPPRRRPRPR